MADPKFDPAAHAQKAQELRALATKARDALRADTVERMSRLGRERDDTAREVHAAEQEIAAANQQVKRELAVAEKYEKEAAALERKASELERNVKRSITAEGEAEDAREQAAEQRALATVARERVRAAEQAVDHLEDEVHEKRLEVERLEKQLAAEPERRAELEEQVDNLEWHAREAEGFARNVQVLADEEAKAAAAERNGDAVAAAAARARAADLRSALEVSGDVRAVVTGMMPDAQKLQMIGITVPDTFLDTPGFPSAPPPPAPEAPEPTSQIEDVEPVDGTPAPDDDVLTAGLELTTDDDDVDAGDPVAGDVDAGLASGDDVAIAVEASVGGESVTDGPIDDAPLEPTVPEFTSVADESDAVLAELFEPQPEPDLTSVEDFDVDEPAEFLDG